jgi:flagellar hook-associated protein 2
MSGMASGVDTDSIIQKLMDVESKPIKQFEQEIAKSRTKKDILKVLQNHLEDLNKKSQDLYGFRASYDDKKAVSSDEFIITAAAGREAIPGIRKVKVLQLASNHRLSTDTFKESHRIPPGTFTIEVNGESKTIDFKGGKLASLRERIDEEVSSLVNTSIVKTTGEDYLITLESKIDGKKGEIKLSGDEGFLKEAGLIREKREDERSDVKIVFDRRFFSFYSGEKKIEGQKGSLQISPEGKTATIKEILWQEYTMSVPYDVKKDTRLEFDFAYKAPGDVDDLKDVPGRIVTGPEEKINIKGIELKGYNISRIRKDDREKEKHYDTLFGIGVVSGEGAQRVEKIFPVDKDAKGRQEIPLGKEFEGKKITKVVFYCNSGVVDFTDARFTDPEEETGKFTPKNRVSEARNSKVNVDGTDIEREKNSGLNDVIKGLTLDLKKVSDHPVDLKVDHDATKAIEKIKLFVESYNKYLELHQELIKSEKADKPGDYSTKKNKGAFVGDATIIRLETSIKNTVSGAYPSRADKQIKLLSQIGVSTGKINAAWETIKEGKLVIDEAELETVLRENPEGVGMFFGSDTDGDNKVNSGMAFTLVSVLRPYVMPGKNIIASKMDLEDATIKNASTRIEKQEQHLKSFEQKLRMKFGAMEKSIQGSKAQQNWMNQQMKSSDGSQ